MEDLHGSCESFPPCMSLNIWYSYDSLGTCAFECPTSPYVALSQWVCAIAVFTVPVPPRP